MESHKVAIDDDVFQFVKGHAEPLVDDFSSVLRRLLKVEGSLRTRPSEEVLGHEVPALPKRVPAALRQVLEVTHLVRKCGLSRTAATQLVAKRYGVFPQTVIDKYSRQLQLTAGDFDQLLEENLAALRERLKSKFDKFEDVLDAQLK